MARTALSHEYTDTDDLAAALHELADAIEDGEAPVQAVETGEALEVGDPATESLTVRYSLSESFRGIDPLQYDDDPVEVK